MKIFHLFIVVFVLSTIFTFSIFAQPQKKPDIRPAKVATVNTKAFEDEKSGIRDLVIAYDQLEIELKPQTNELQNLSFELQKLHKEISKDGEELKKIQPEHGTLVSEVKAKIERYEKLTSEFKIKQENYDSLYEKRKSEVITPINNQIGDALKRFAKEKGYMMILDSSKINSSLALIEEDPIDVTKEFIQFYNDNSEKQKPQ